VKRTAAIIAKPLSKGRRRHQFHFRQNYCHRDTEKGRIIVKKRSDYCKTFRTERKLLSELQRIELDHSRFATYRERINARGVFFRILPYLVRTLRSPRDRWSLWDLILRFGLYLSTSQFLKYGIFYRYTSINWKLPNKSQLERSSQYCEDPPIGRSKTKGLNPRKVTISHQGNKL
jgi:hypothetical protein